MRNYKTNNQLGGVLRPGSHYITYALQMGVHINTTQIITKIMDDKCGNILSFSPFLFLISNVFNVYVQSKFFQSSFDVMHRCGVWCVGGVRVRRRGGFVSDLRGAGAGDQGDRIRPEQSPGAGSTWRLEPAVLTTDCGYT